MDASLAASARPGMVLAGRFLDAGPWFIGFGIVHALKKSEAVAICLALAHDGELDDTRGGLHELVYPCRIHGDDLVLAAIAPMVTAMALAIDASGANMAAILSGLGEAPRPGGRPAKRSPAKARARSKT